MTAAIAIAYAALLVASAVTDLVKLQIPNAFVVALLGLFAIACVVNPPQSLVVTHILPAVVVFALTAVLFFAGGFGGGDVKLLSVAVLWVGLGALGPFLISLAVYGVVSILIFALCRQRIVTMLEWVGAHIGHPIPTPASLKSGQVIPYGIVIAASALTIGPQVLMR